MNKEQIEKRIEKGSCRELLSILETGKLEVPPNYRTMETTNIPEDMQEKLAKGALKKRKGFQKFLAGLNLTVSTAAYVSFVGIILHHTIGFPRFQVGVFLSYAASLGMFCITAMTSALEKLQWKKSQVVLDIENILSSGRVTSDEAITALEKLADVERGLLTSWGNKMRDGFRNLKKEINQALDPIPNKEKEPEKERNKSQGEQKMEIAWNNLMELKKEIPEENAIIIEEVEIEESQDKYAL